MKIYQVDAFTSERFKGNPAGVCILPENTVFNDIFLQNIASEMNLSETAFLNKRNNEYDLRWFTPVTEVSFCGHATLSSAHILWELGIVESDKMIVFNTKSGKLYAKKRNDNIELNFPIYEVSPIDSSDIINNAFGINPLFLGTDKKRYLIEVSNYETLINIHPNFHLVKEIGQNAFMITCKSDNQEYDFYSRSFAPYVGVNEDPVTGSAHSYLAPYWSKKLKKNKLKAYQASKRGGEILCELTDNNRVLLLGKAVTIFEIEMKC